MTEQSSLEDIERQLLDAAQREGLESIQGENNGEVDVKQDVGDVKKEENGNGEVKVEEKKRKRSRSRDRDRKRSKSYV